jgi:hypothetical protein
MYNRQSATRELQRNEIIMVKRNNENLHWGGPLSSDERQKERGFLYRLTRHWKKLLDSTRMDEENDEDSTRLDSRKVTRSFRVAA